MRHLSSSPADQRRPCTVSSCPHNSPFRHCLSFVFVPCSVDIACSAFAPASVNCWLLSLSLHTRFLAAQGTRLIALLFALNTPFARGRDYDCTVSDTRLHVQIAPRSFSTACNPGLDHVCRPHSWGTTPVFSKCSHTSTECYAAELI